MTEKNGYYSIIQYCPDLLRLEAANIGVLLFCPEKNFLDVRVVSNMGRIKKFFGDQELDYELIKMFCGGFRKRVLNEKPQIETLDLLNNFIDRRANDIRISEPRTMLVGDPKKDLNVLFEECVGEVTHKKRQATTVKKKFLEGIVNDGIENLIRKDIGSITVPVYEHSCPVDFAFQNGRLNLIRAERFDLESDSQAFAKACAKAIDGKALYEKADDKYGKLQLVVLGQFGSRHPKRLIQAKKIFSQHCVNLYSEKEVPELVDTIRETAHPIDD